MAALTFNWLGRLGGRRRAPGAPVPLMPSRDLPPVDGFTRLPMPRSPEPMPDEALVFAQGATRRALHVVESPEAEDMPVPAASSIATGADLRAMLERFERAHRRRQALSQSAQARSRIVERLSAGKAASRPALQIVGAGGLSSAQAAAEDERRIDAAMEEALASALVTLKRLSALARD